MASVVPIPGQVQEYNGRTTLLIILSCFMASSGGFVLGYDLGISGGVTSMSTFLQKFFPDVQKKKLAASVSNYCKFDSQLLTLFTSSLYLAGFVASFFGMMVTRAFGRRPTILVGGVAFLAGSALGSAASDLLMLIFSRILLGVGLGFANQAVPLYISEVALPKHRGKMSAGFGAGITIGVLGATVTNFETVKIVGGWGWRVSLAMPALPAAILTLCALFLPETPNCLMLKSKNHPKARHVLERLRGTNDVEVEFDDLLKTRASSTSFQFKKILLRKYRPQVLMAVILPIFQQFTGIDIITFYSPILFRTIGKGETDSLMLTVVVRLVATAAVISMTVLVDKIGRRKLYIIGGIFLFLSLLGLGGVFAAKLGDHGSLSEGYARLIVALVCLYMAAFSLSWGPLTYLVSSEIYPLEIRSELQSITVGVLFLLNFAFGQCFLAMLCHMKSGVFFFFGVWMVISTVFVFFLLPESNNVPIELMEKVWNEHWFWRRFSEVDVEEKKNQVHSMVEMPEKQS